MAVSKDWFKTKPYRLEEESYFFHVTHWKGLSGFKCMW